MGVDEEKTTAPARSVLGASAPRSVARIVHSPDAAKVGIALELSAADAAYTLGRSAEIALNDARLSRNHCRIQRAGNGVRVEDLGSRNGTFLNGRKIERDYAMPGMVLRLGDSLLVFDEEPSDAAGRTDALGSVPELAGDSFAVQALRHALALAGPTSGAVLLRGPTGAGKELAARAVHRLSKRTGSFVPVNCAAIAPEIADAELFGHRKGAFTGADENRPGLFGEADGGTLFLDELGDLPPGLQVKLLRALEEKRIRPVGATTYRAVDVRVVAATNVDLERSGFRADLKARLSHWVIQLPLLAARRADILLLARNFLFQEAPGFAAKPWTAEFVEALLLHDWPTSVRELQNEIRRLPSLDGGRGEWDVDLLPHYLRDLVLERRAEAATSAQGGPSKKELEAALQAANGNVAEVAQKYERDRTQVYRWLERYGLDAAQFRQSRAARRASSVAVTDESVTTQQPGMAKSSKPE